MSLTISMLLKNLPKPPNTTIQALTEPPGLVHNILLPPPTTPTQNGKPQTPPTQTTSPIKQSAPPHLEAPNSSKLNTPSKRPRKAPPIMRQCTMSTRSASLQVTSQQELHKDDMDKDGDMLIETKAKAVSNNLKPEFAPTDSMAHIDPTEQLMMQFPH